MRNMKLSDDIREWCLELEDDDMVLFEDFRKTLIRGQIEDEEDEIENEFEESESDFPIKLKDMPNICMSPMGPVLIPELTNANQYFKLWTLYSKIPLSNRILSKIESSPGIETIEPLTRYRARIGICPLFKDYEVMNKIKKIIIDSKPCDINSI